MEEFRIPYKPFGGKEMTYVDKLVGGVCYRDRVSGGVLRWFLPYPDDDFTVLYRIQRDGTSWSEAECGCWAGNGMLALAGFGEDDVERIDLDDFIRTAELLLGTGPTTGTVHVG